jgi:D-glycero-D-manno-heptose 1,7-bisphosphate phosphatase
LISYNKNKACFLDRDGVLIEEANYISLPSQVHILPGTIKALQLLKDNNYKIIVITNQAGVAKGYFIENAIPKVHSEIDRQLNEYGIQVDRYYYCPHHPNGIIKKYAICCNCRKPMPGMILQAKEDYNLDLNSSFLIGDKMSDLLAAEKSGCHGVLVETGYGKQYKKEAIVRGFPVLPNLKEAVLFSLK